MLHLETLLFREIKRILRTSQSEHGWTTGVLLISRGRVCVRSHHIKIPPTWDASVSLQQIYDTDNTQIEWKKGHTDNTSLEADLNREADACLHRSVRRRVSCYLKGGADDLTLERLSLVTVLKLKQKQQNHSGDSLPTRSHIASPSHCTLSRESRLVPMLLCSEFRWAGLWPCPKRRHGLQKQQSC